MLIFNICLVWFSDTEPFSSVTSAMLVFSLRQTEHSTATWNPGAFAELRINNASHHDCKAVEERESGLNPQEGFPTTVLPVSLCRPGRRVLWGAVSIASAAPRRCVPGSPGWRRDSVTLPKRPAAFSASLQCSMTTRWDGRGYPNSCFLSQKFQALKTICLYIHKCI